MCPKRLEGETVDSAETDGILCHHHEPGSLTMVFDHQKPGLKVELKGPKTYVETADETGTVVFGDIVVGDYIVKIVE